MNFFVFFIENENSFQHRDEMIVGFILDIVIVLAAFSMCGCRIACVENGHPPQIHLCVCVEYIVTHFPFPLPPSTTITTASPPLDLFVMWK